MVLEWNLSNTDTFGTKIIVLISEVSLFQGEVGTQSNAGVHISEVHVL